jgi:hypothetical protein
MPVGWKDGENLLGAASSTPAFQSSHLRSTNMTYETRGTSTSEVPGCRQEV